MKTSRTFGMALLISGICLLTVFARQGAETGVTHPSNFAKSPPRPTLARLGEISAPTLIIVGEADIPDVHAHAGAIQAGIPKAKRMVLPGTGHLPYLERPDAFNAPVLRFLAGQN